MKFIRTPIEGLWEIETEKKGDARGFLTRLYCKNEFSNIDVTDEFVQENLTFTKNKGTFRGFHFQLPPYGEIKLIRCISGKVIDYAIDLRENSLTFLESYSVVLDSDKLNMVLIPEGFAHGFQTLTENCLMLYLHSNYYNPEYERGINISDPKINIKLPLNISEISDRDKMHLFLETKFKGI